MEMKRSSLWGALVILLICTVLIVWFVTMLTNGDPLWFLRHFNAPADWITIYWDGEVYVLVPGDADYAAVMQAFAEGIAQWGGYEGSVGISDENLARFREEWRMIEVHYNTPVQVHTRHSFPVARNFFVPLSGTHANYRRVFAGLGDTPRAGVLNMRADYFGALQTVVAEAVQRGAP